MDACTGISTAHLVGAVLTFLAAVVSLDVFWVRSEDQVHGGDIADALRKRGRLNALVAAGAGGRSRSLVLVDQHLRPWAVLSPHRPERQRRAKEKARTSAGLLTQYKLFRRGDSFDAGPHGARASHLSWTAGMRDALAARGALSGGLHLTEVGGISV